MPGKPPALQPARYRAVSMQTAIQHHLKPCSVIIAFGTEWTKIEPAFDFPVPFISVRDFSDLRSSRQR